MDALLGRDSRASKFKSLAKLTISRIAVLRNQHRARFSYARSDVVELLRLGRQQSALLRVEHVIKEQNTLDVFVLIEKYCQLLLETVDLLHKNKEFPVELKETMSNLIFASSRCGEFPELQEIRSIFSAKISKGFAARAIELRNPCGVNPKMIQKLSSRQPSLETRWKVLMKIASENGLTLHLEDDSPLAPKEKLHINQNMKQLDPSKLPNLKDPDPRDDTQDIPEELKFSRQDSHENDSDSHGGPNHCQGNKNVSGDRLQRPKHQVDDYTILEEIKNLRKKLGIENIRPPESFSSESESEETAECFSQTHLEDGNNRASKTRTISDSSSDSEGEIISKIRQSLEPQGKNEPEVYSLVSERTDDSARMGHGIIPWTKHHTLDSDAKPASNTNNYKNFHEHNASVDDGNKLGYLPQKWIPLNTRAGAMAKSIETSRSDFVEQLKSQHTDTAKNHLSVRTRRQRWD
ncbi:uncharacterized protein LOC119995353 isoform X2 [Tripterygium wilfordii]|uniref:uncharacterized protein LOC119995353 isoform X2 n=1 Tax=Tripterygium wilfordii TaxID=458696 RepID=UPI0018F7E7FE|nr:uncharacterized protein LOC119995353 isoform X2 [Tripterygium wilfordii]